MFRPDGWENPYFPHMKPPEACESQVNVHSHENIFEAGADAMLEELRKNAVTLRIADQSIDVPGFDIVFIPEEE